MTESKKPLAVEFAPGCFDDFEGTQEELEKFVSEIQSMFANMTSQELEAKSRPVSLDDIEELDEKTQQQILSALTDLDNDERTQKLN